MTTTQQNPAADATDHAHGDDHVDHNPTYFKVFASLTVFTAIELVYAQIFANTFVVLVLGLMTWAIIKAALVGLYFMHLKYEGKWVYAMLVPAGILAIVVVAALIPDVVLKADVDMNEGDDDAPAVHAAAPAAAGSGAHGAATH